MRVAMFQRLSRMAYLPPAHCRLCRRRVTRCRDAASVALPRETPRADEYAPCSPMMPARMRTRERKSLLRYRCHSPFVFSCRGSTLLEADAGISRLIENVRISADIGLHAASPVERPSLRLHGWRLLRRLRACFSITAHVSCLNVSSASSITPSTSLLRRPTIIFVNVRSIQATPEFFRNSSFIFAACAVDTVSCSHFSPALSSYPTSHRFDRI